MNRALLAMALVAVLVLPGAVEAQNGRVSDSYIQLQVVVDFQYSSDQDVRLPVFAALVLNGVQQATPVKLRVVSADDHSPIEIPGGQDWLNQGVKAYPALNEVNFGKLETGRYEWLFIAEAGGYSEEVLAPVSVTHPPRPYEAALLGTGDKEAVFMLAAENVTDVFHVTMYRDGGNGKVTLERAEGTQIELRVPYVPNEAVKITVQGPNGWINYDNKYTDFQTGAKSYPDWQWNPDYKTITNYRQASAGEATIVAGLILTLIGCLGVIVWLRRRQDY